MRVKKVRMPPVVFKVQEDAPRMQGWLKKKGKRLKMWTKRWCVLDWDEMSHTALLVMYDSVDTTVVPHTSISLYNGIVHPEPSQDEEDAKGGGSGKYAFSVDTTLLAARCSQERGGERGDGEGGGRVFLLYAESREERDRWVKDLRWSAANSNIDNSYVIDRVRPEGCLGTGAFSVVWR